jgi:hypothetical protein
LLAVVVLLFYLTQSHWELQQVVRVALAIYLQVEQAVHQRLQTQAAQAVAVAVTLPLAVTHQVMMVELAAMVAVAVAVPTTLEQAVQAVMAYFISTTKRGKQWQHMQ